jgi:hypothetical protein
VFYFNDSTTNTKFILDTHPKTFDDAAAQCRKYGAQMASFDTYDEQYNAEQYYVEELVGGGRGWGCNLAASLWKVLLVI